MFTMNAVYRMLACTEWPICSSRYSPMLVDTDIHFLLCAPYVRGLASLAGECVNNIRAQLSRNSVLEANQFHNRS